MAFSIMTFSIMTLSIMTISIKINKMQYSAFYAECYDWFTRDKRSKLVLFKNPQFVFIFQTALA